MAAEYQTAFTVNRRLLLPLTLCFSVPGTGATNRTSKAESHAVSAPMSRGFCAFAVLCQRNDLRPGANESRSLCVCHAVFAPMSRGLCVLWFWALLGPAKSQTCFVVEHTKGQHHHAIDPEGSAYTIIVVHC